MSKTPEETPAPAASEKPAETPPWGDSFDAEKAWKLIENLRSDKEKLSAREVLTPDQKEKLAEYDRLVEASQTESERRDKQLAQLQESTARIPTLEAENLRLQVALEKGLVGERADLAARLQGSTREELAEDADKLLALLGPAGTDPRAPKPNPAQGSSGSGQAPARPKDLGEALARHYQRS